MLEARNWSIFCSFFPSASAGGVVSSILDATRVSTSRRDGTHATRDPSASKGQIEGDAQNNIKKN